MSGLQPGIVQCFHDFQPGQHTVDAVVLAAAGLRVQVAARDNWRQIFRAGPAGKNVADGVDPYAAASCLAPGDKLVPARLVLIGQGLAIAAASGCGAEPGHLRQA